MADNLARRLETNEDEVRRLNEEYIKRKASSRRAEKKLYTFCTLIAFVLAIVVVSRYMTINELDRQVTKAQTEYDKLKSANDQKAVMLESSMTLEEIEYAAKTRLGMNKPANNQIIYVEVQKEDTAYVAGN